MHFIFCYKNIPVVDAKTGQSEIAQYQMVFGFIARIKYF